MFHSRREFLTGAAAIISAAPLTMAASTPDVPRDLVTLFEPLPGTKSLKIYAPATKGKPKFLLEFNSSAFLFVGSVIKTFVLCEALRQADSPDIVRTISQKQLPLNESIWNIDSPTLNPPHLAGEISERTALEAMIMHSDNTGTDMSFKLVGPDNVRKFIASAGLHNTLVPDSTRVFFGYLFDAKDYQDFTWDDLQKAILDKDPIINSPLNRVETLASSADDLVSYYSRALQGAFFKNRQTLNEFRRILSLGDAIWLVPLPLGVSAFVKGGSIDVPHFHCLSIPGGMFFSDRWVYFAATINWYAPAEQDPKTAAGFAAALAKVLGEVKDLLST